jgi:hypothetical protein
VPARDLRLQRALRRILADVSFAKAAQMANHASTRTTQLYDPRRGSDGISETVMVLDGIGNQLDDQSERDDLCGRRGLAGGRLPK